MIDKKRSLMFRSMFKIGCVGFGGGSALIPVIEKEVVQEQGLVTKKEYDKDMIVASITPGALPVEIAAGLGKRAYGVRGMVFAALLMAFPGVLITILLLSVLSQMDAALLKQIEFVSIGIVAFISCLLTDYAYESVRVARKESVGRCRRTIVILSGVFFLTAGKNLSGMLSLDRTPVFSLSTIQILGMAFFGILYTRCRFRLKNIIVTAVTLLLYLACAGTAQLIQNEMLELGLKLWMAVLALRGLYQSIAGEGKQRKFEWCKMLQDEGVWLLLLIICSIPAFLISNETFIYLVRGFISSILSFGGGDAYLSVADGMFVSTGMITESDFYGHLVSIVNVLPGSILCKTLAGVGYFIGYNQDQSLWSGYLVALSGFACSVAASGGVFCLIYYVYECFEKLDVFRLIRRWIRPIIAGLLLNVMLSMINQNLAVGVQYSFDTIITLAITAVIYGINIWLYYKKKQSNGMLILVSAVLSIVLCNAVDLL